MVNPWENPLTNIQKGKETKNESQENKKEKEAEEISENRGGLFGRVVQRVLEERKEAQGAVKNMPEEALPIYSVLKKIPFLRGYITSLEGVYGAEPGKELNTKEALIKCGTGMLMVYADVLKLKEKAETGKIPENVFKGRTIGWVKKEQEETLSFDPDSERSKFLRAITEFLEENKPVVEYYEGKIGELAKA